MIHLIFFNFFSDLFFFFEGGANKRKGRDGGNTYIEVPVGTIVKRVKDEKVFYSFFLKRASLLIYLFVFYPLHVNKLGGIIWF